jgi:hypothetical protein
VAATLKGAAVTKAAATLSSLVIALTKTSFAPPKAATTKATIPSKGGAPKAVVVKMTTPVVPNTVGGVVVIKTTILWGKRGPRAWQKLECEK